MSTYFVGKSDCGLVRKNNEDSFLILPNIVGGTATGLILADGMGGHNKGEVASSVAVTYAAERLCKEINQHLSPREIGEVMAEIVERANVKVYLESLLSPENTGMGTTLTMAMVTDDLLVISHVGDCRVYRKRKSKLQILTTDHNYASDLYNKGEITQEQLIHHPGRHYMTKALGMAQYINADVYIYNIAHDDRLLICTDGLYGYVSDREIFNILTQSDDAESCARQMIESANKNGGGDNVTVLVGFV